MTKLLNVKNNKYISFVTSSKYDKEHPNGHSQRDTIYENSYAYFSNELIENWIIRAGCFHYVRIIYD